MRIRPGRRAEELTCDLVGLTAARLFIRRVPTAEALARRAARAIEHNCVDSDLTDSAHLSPLDTMRALIAIEPEFTRELTGESRGTTAGIAVPQVLRRDEAGPGWAKAAYN